MDELQTLGYLLYLLSRRIYAVDPGGNIVVSIVMFLIVFTSRSLIEMKSKKMTKVKVTLESYGHWQATAHDDLGTLATVKAKTKDGAKKAIMSKIAESVEGEFRVEWLDLSEGDNV